jgi:hypothetical protein
MTTTLGPPLGGGHTSHFPRSSGFIAVGLSRIRSRLCCRFPLGEMFHWVMKALPRREYIAIGEKRVVQERKGDLVVR